MAMIADVVKLKTGYANFVELKSAYEEAQENAERMAMYRPTKAHRQAFERICRGLYQPNDKKFYLLSGSYGTGKSHLCLMSANFLSRSSGDPEISGFYDNYAKLDGEQARLLKNIRTSGQYLVAICDYHSGRRFEDVVLKAVFDACAARNLDAGVDTEFDEAERQLGDWEKKSSKIRNFFEDFGKAVEAVCPGLSVDQLRNGLKQYNSEALENFRAAYQEMMGGVEFQAKSGNLIPILRKLVRSAEFKKRFKGLAIFFDEFGFTLEKAAYSKDVLQGFMETICKNEPNVVFVGCIHKDFKSYADRFSQDDAAVMSARITQVDLLNEGIEEIIGAIVETDKHCETWKKEVAPKTGVFDQLVPHCKTLDLFPWIDDVKRIRQRVLEDIYGVHPMALSCLLKLSSEVGSDARSTFTFFSGDVGGEEGSYADFIGKADLTVNGGKLNLYTVDRLFNFFRKELSLRNPELRERQRQFVNGFYASLDALRKSAEQELFELEHDDRVRVLQTVLLYQLCQIPTNLDNLQFGLYCLSKSEQKQVELWLNDLTRKGAVFFRQQSKTYELAASTGEDPYDLIERFVNDPSLHPRDTVQAFLEEAGAKTDLEFLEAKGYNLPFNEDKRLRIQFVRAKDLSDKLWEEIRDEWRSSQAKPKSSCEGTIVYALCEDDAEVKIARDAAKSIPDENVALAVPHAPLPFAETLLRVKACRHYLPPNEAEKISAQTESRLRDIFENPDDGYLPVLQRTLSAIMDGDSACWYTKDGKVLVDKPKQPHKPADMLCEMLFSKRCRVKHPDLNFSHDDKWRTGKNNALKQAVNNLLDADRVLIDNGNPDNHGEKRYLEKVLLKGAGALRKTGSEGVVTYFDCDHDPQKISPDFPVLKDLCERLNQLNPGQALPLGTFLEEARKPPYGAGGTALILVLAHLVRAYGERLTVYKDSTKMDQKAILSYDDVADIVGDAATKIVLEVREITLAQMKLVDLVAKAVDAPALKHGEVRSLNGAFEALKTWWSNVKPVAQIPHIYEKKSQKRLEKLRDAMADSTGSADRFDFVLSRLPEVYAGGPVDDSLTETDAETYAKAFEADVKILDSGAQIVRSDLADAICKVYGASGDMVACERAVTSWYKNLSPVQRDPHKCDHEDAEQYLTRLADHSAAFDTKMTRLLPKDYGFGPLDEWSSLHIDEFASKIKQAKEEIDKAKPIVPKPDIEEKVYEVRESAAKYVPVPSGAKHIIYTIDGSDPRTSDSAQKAESDLDLSALLKDRPTVTVKMRSIDADGNVSDSVAVELVSKERKYEILVDKDLFGEEKATFKCPEDMEGLVAALKSVLKYGSRKKIISDAQRKQIESEIDKLSGK